MAKEPAPESVARAARLRKQIEELTNVPSREDKDAPPKPSPRDFIHKRMNELDKKDE